MIDQNILFSKPDLSTQLDARRAQAPNIVDAIPKEQFLISDDQELLAYVVSQLAVEPLALCEDAIAMTQSETKVDISNDRMRLFPHGHSGPYFVPGTCVSIKIPFTGDAWIFHYLTNPFSSAYPRAELLGDHLRISISQPSDADTNLFKGAYDRELNLIRTYVNRGHAQVVDYNKRLPHFVQQAIDDRRQRLGRHENIAALLDIPMAEKPGAPTITPVKLEVKKPPALPVPPKTGLAPEPGISDSTFEHILSFIRHQGRTFERTPKTFAVHGEEELRDIILAQLNGHFQGDAVGEAFRGKGKTDICIEQENRAAFVGECKLWTGPVGLKDALDQLLGYLTWRDSKAALILFNVKNKDFSKILEALPEALRQHQLFVSEQDCSEAGEWRMKMSSREDVGRRVEVHTFVFNLFVP